MGVVLKYKVERSKYIMSVDVQRVKAFNDELKKYNEKAAKNAAEIEFNNREIKRICDELTAELGVQVTPENIAQIAEERIAKIENTLQVGEAILARIKQEEEAAANVETQPVTQAIVGQQANPLAQPATPLAQPAAQNQQTYQQQPAFQGYQIDQFSQPQPAQPAQQTTQGMPQMQPFGGMPNMGSFPTFQVGNKPQQAQETPSQEIGNVNLFGTGAVQI